MRSVCDVHTLIPETNNTETVATAGLVEEQTRGASKHLNAGSSFKLRHKTEESDFLVEHFSFQL